MPRELKLTVPFDGTPEKPIDATVYVFRSRGDLIGTATLKGGTATLSLEDSVVPQARIVIGPSVPAESGMKPTLSQLEKLGAYEPVIAFVPDKHEYTLSPIPSDLWKRWMFCRCRVTGRVVKAISVDGTMQELPVCHATVHILEVDPVWLWLRRLPDPDLLKLRAELLGEIERLRLPLGRELPVIEGAQPTLTRVTLPLELRAALSSDSPVVVRKALLANPTLVTPFLCHPPWRWIWPWLRTTEIRVVETNDQGRFEATIWHPCVDTPDLYFRVEYAIDGVLTTIYARPVACDTHWDYKCGSEITLHVTDARVPVCAPPPRPGLSIDVKRVGQTGYLHRIRREHVGSVVSPDRGLIAWSGVLDPRTAEIPTETPVPFAGGLYLYADFSEGLRAGTIATHYRWSYRHVPQGAPVGPWIPITAPIVRNFIVHLPGGLSRTASYPLSETVSSGVYFKLQPIHVPAELHPDGAAEWTVLNEKIDIASAYFDTVTPGLGLFDDLTAAGPQGVYECKLELFQKDAAGSMIPVDLDAAGIGVNVWGVTGNVADPIDFVTAPEDNLIRTTGTSPHRQAFRMLLRVDNNPLDGTIADASVPSFPGHSGSVGTCGFIDYPAGGSLVTLGFHAWQRNSFATYIFEVSRGSSGPIVHAEARVTAAPAPFAAISSGTFQGGFATATLTGPSGTPPVTCGDGRAAFAETLRLWSLTTDGEHRQGYLYVPPKAFALNPV